MPNRSHIVVSMRFWEIGRIPYNLLLLGVTAMAGYVVSKQCTDCGAPPSVFDLAAEWFIPGNLFYCVGYFADWFVANPHFRTFPRRMVLWVLVATAASYLAWVVASTFLNPDIANS